MKVAARGIGVDASFAAKSKFKEVTSSLEIKIIGFGLGLSQEGSETLVATSLQEYNEVMKSEIAVTRRTTYRAEENVTNLEKAKKKQDLLIDSMNEEIKRLNEQKTLYQAQLISQKEETAAARNTLKEAAIEIERIVMSKKTLLEDWQKSLFGMQQRDKAL